MRKISLTILVACLLPGCALTNPFVTTTSGDNTTLSESTTNQETSPDQITELVIKSSDNNQVESTEASAALSNSAEQLQQTEATETVTGDSKHQASDSTASDSEIKDESYSKTKHEVSYPGITIDIWDRIRDGFKLEDREHARIDQQLKWFASHQEYLDRVAERAQPYMFHIVEELEANNIPLEIALLPIVESAFKPFAYSHGRASGIWQFIPSTGKRYGLKQDWWYDGRRDVYASTDAAIKLLTALHKEFDGDWMLALAAYNSGSGNVRRAIRYNKKRGRPTDFFYLNLPKETKYYVPKLLALKKLVAEPDKYGVTLARITNKPYLEKVDIDSQIDLALAAELAGIELDTLYRLNPGFNRWATSPNGPHDLLLPLEYAETFKENLAEYPPEKRIQWKRHKIKQGETISTIAGKYNVSVSTIKRVNRLKSNQLRAGRSLTIPVASKKLSEYTLSANQRKQQQQNVPRNGTKITHIVQAGDTLWDLAMRHKVGVRSLAKWNGMAPRDTLSVGQKIVIWSRNASAKSDYDPAHISAPPERAVTQRIGYRVRPGDSLALIARKFKVSVGELLRWNSKVTKSKYLQPGQRIVLYVDVTSTSS